MDHKDSSREDREIALDRIVEEASLGNPAMCALLAMKYEFGMDIPKNSHIAWRWLHRAAELGDPWAQFSLGDAYATGRLGNDVVPTLAFEWFIKAFKNSAKGAADRLAMCYERGYGIETDKGESLKYWLISAQEGSPWAKIHLARMFQLGRGTQIDTEQASCYLKESFDAFQKFENVIEVALEQANSLYTPAMELLGFAYLNGWFGCHIDEDMANEWFKRADKK